MKVETKNMKLLFVGDANWNYYMDEAGTCFAVAKKGSGASDSYFGNKEYFKRYILKELKKNDKHETRLTATGFSLIPEYEIQIKEKA